MEVGSTLKKLRSIYGYKAKELAVVKSCAKAGIGLTTWHWDRRQGVLVMFFTEKQSKTNVICPYCEHRMSPKTSRLAELMNLDKEIPTVCESCGKAFVLTATAEITYTTKT